MPLQLPNPNPAWIYEGFDPANFEDATGINTNRAPKQIHANVEFLLSVVNSIKGDIRVVTTNVNNALVSQLIWCDTTSAAISVNLPANPNQGDYLAVGDYAGTCETNAITVLATGSKINGLTSNLILNTNFQLVVLEYVDSTIGWRVKFNSFPLERHLAAPDPHPQYTTANEAAAIAIDNAISFAIALG